MPLTHKYMVVHRAYFAHAHDYLLKWRDTHCWSALEFDSPNCRYAQVRHATELRVSQTHRMSTRCEHHHFQCNSRHLSLAKVGRRWLQSLWVRHRKFLYLDLLMSYRLMRLLESPAFPGILYGIQFEGANLTKFYTWLFLGIWLVFQLE